jgi:hypothetical protein
MITTWLGKHESNRGKKAGKKQEIDEGKGGAAQFDFDPTR